MQRLRLPETVSAGAVIRQPCLFSAVGAGAVRQRSGRLFLIKGDPAVEPLEDGGHGIRAVRKLLKAFLLLRGFDEAEAVRIGTGPDTVLPHGNMIAHPLKAARQGLFFFVFLGKLFFSDHGFSLPAALSLDRRSHYTTVRPESKRFPRLTTDRAEHIIFRGENHYQ